MVPETSFVELRSESMGGRSPLLHRQSSGILPATSKKCSLPFSAVNLLKNIVGAGVLSLPSGIAAFSDERSSVTSGLLAAALVGALSAYTFALVGRVCAETNAWSYTAVFVQVWGEAAGAFPELVIICKLTLACIMYSIIMGDMMVDIAKLFSLPEPFVQREVLVVAEHALVLLPLAFLRSLAALTPFSALGVLGTTFTAGFMAYRLHQGAYSPGGEFYDAAPEEPSFSSQGTDYSAMPALVSMLATAYVAHFNAPRYRQELAASSDARFMLLSAWSFAGALALLGSVAAFGFLTFGGSCKGNILVNYAADDTLAAVARVGVFTSVVTGYPFVLGALRDALLEFYLRRYCGGAQPSLFARDVTACATMCCTMGVALVMTDLGKLVELGGAIFANCIVYLLPALMYLGLEVPKVRAGESDAWGKVHCAACCAIFVVSALLAFLGVREGLGS